MNRLPLAVWLKWSDVPWLSKSQTAASTVGLCDQLLRVATSAEHVADFLHEQLSAIAAECSARWAAVIRKTPPWQTVVEFGRSPLAELPFALLDEVLDREAGGHGPLDDADSGAFLTVPLPSHTHPASVLLLAGGNLTAEWLPQVLAIGRVLGACLDIVAARDRADQQIARLESILHIASAIADIRETQPLLKRIADEATRLLDCDRASIFIHDKEHHQVVACPALGVEGGTLRLSDDVGVVGQVIGSGKPARVDDAYDDSRFDKSVDKGSGYKTRNLLCTPLRDSDGVLIGAFEAVNKNDGSFTDVDEVSLTQLGIQAAAAIRNTKEREQLIRSREQLAEQVTQGMQLIGDSPAIVALRSTIIRLAETDLPVLILGESGTGKEVVAQALHYRGPRAEHPFVAVNCAALTETLLESELFGHEKGAFTDAHEMRKGKFELAEQGTLFLDEIGDMSPGGQAKLLRVLEQKEITRVGGSQPIPIDVRVIAATNTDLAVAVREKRFREDLYYRIGVVTQHLPPLRERPEDIIPLAEHFLGRFSEQARRRGMRLSAESRRRLQAHGWPGNVREVRNLMERVAFLSGSERVEVDDLAFILSPDRSTAAEPSLDIGLGEATKQFQQDFIQRCIRRVRGNMSEAARLLGLHRSNLYRKMRQLDMNEGDDEE